MFSFFKGRKKSSEPAEKKSSKPELPYEIRIEERERPLFGRALQLYIFVHHVPHKKLPDELAAQLRHTSNAVYSLIFNWLKDGKPSLEYMEFLNDKVNELRKLGLEQAAHFEIPPAQLHHIELQQIVRMRFLDEDREHPVYIRYVKAEGRCRHNVGEP